MMVDVDTKMLRHCSGFEGSDTLSIYVQNIPRKKSVFCFESLEKVVFLMCEKSTTYFLLKGGGGGGLFW